MDPQFLDVSEARHKKRQTVVRGFISTYRQRMKNNIMLTLNLSKHTHQNKQHKLLTVYKFMCTDFSIQEAAQTVQRATEGQSNEAAQEVSTVNRTRTTVCVSEDKARKTINQSSIKTKCFSFFFL